MQYEEQSEGEAIAEARGEGIVEEGEILPGGLRHTEGGEGIEGVGIVGRLGHHHEHTALGGL